MRTLALRLKKVNDLAGYEVVPGEPMPVYIFNDPAGSSSLFVEAANGAVYGPDQTGDARGADSINISTGRNADNQVSAGDYSIAVGFRSRTVSGEPFGVAIGFSASAHEEGVAIGRYANASLLPQGVAIGRSAFASYRAVAVGRQAVATNTGGIAIGNDTYSIGSGTIAIGDGANIGAGNGANCMVIGAGASTGYITSTAVSIGHGISNTTSNSLKIGISNTAFMHFTDFTPNAEVVADSTHTLPVTFNGGVYRILLTNA